MQHFNLQLSRLAQQRLPEPERLMQLERDIGVAYRELFASVP